MSELPAITVRTIQELFANGRFDQALAICQTLVDQNPRTDESWFWLGQVQLLLGELTAAKAALEEAVRLNASSANSWTTLSLVVLGLGRAKEAEEFARRAVALDSSRDFVWMNLGSALFQQQQWTAAEAAYREAVLRSPVNAAGWASLAAVELKLDRLDESQKAFERSLSLAPNPNTAVNYALLLVQRGQLRQAAQVLRQVVEQAPTLAVAWIAWGDVQGMLGDPIAAERAYRRVLEIEPRHHQAQLNLACALLTQFKLSEAEAVTRNLVAIHPGDAEAWATLARVQQATARISESLESYRRSVEIAPEPSRHSRWLSAMQYAADVNPIKLLAAHRDWDERFGSGLARPLLPTRPSQESARQLRIGFLSANFCRHPIAFLALPVLEQLDRSRCRVALYHDSFDEDFYTARFKAAADIWQDVRTLSDDELAGLVRRDEIDVLIDLMGHTGLRLRVFARRPAPVLATWLGYVGTTGLAAMDYLIADRYHVQPGEEVWYQESVFRLPNSYAVYGPPPYLPAVNSLPVKEGGQFTFGALANPAKFSPPLLDAWAEILKRTKTSRLLLCFGGLSDIEAQTPIRRQFVERGIAAERLIFHGTAAHPEFLTRYNQIDMALDTQPYSGGVTTCEALWMGVPVVTWPGRTFAGRHATSYLSTAGLTEFVATDVEAYVELAVRWTDQIDELSDLRSSLRDRVSRSPIGDAQQFAADFVRTISAGAEALLH
jgi:protein O-GlcNAc transferase